MSTGAGPARDAMDTSADMPALEVGSESPPEQPASPAPSVFAETAQVLRACSDTLADVAAALGVSASRLGQLESIEHVEIVGTVPVDTFLTWDPQRINSWFTAFDGDLKLVMKLDGLDAESPGPEAILLAGQQPVEAFERFVEYVEAVLNAQGNELQVSVRASVRKIRVQERVATLLSHRPGYLGTPEMLAQTKVLVFYTSSAWYQLLSPRAILDWEAEGIVTDQQRLFVVLCDASGYVGGKALEVLGAGVPDEVRWVRLTRASWRHFLTRARKARLLHDQESYWDTVPRILMPEHFRIKERNPGLDLTQALLASARAALSAALMANTVFGNRDQDLTLRFAGGRPCTCILDASAYSVASPLDPQRQDGISELTRWAYAQPSADRLLIARESLACELPPGGSVSLRDLESAAAGALDAARANLAMYLRGNTKQYFQLRQQAIDAVHTYAKSVRKSIADLTADLVNNLFKTAGLFVGILIANLINHESTVGAQRLAAIAYVLYLGFILFYVMPAQWHRYQREAASVDKELDVISELGHDERSRIREIATADDDDFPTYFWRTVIVYGFMCLLGIAFIGATWIGVPASVPPHVVGLPTP